MREKRVNKLTAAAAAAAATAATTTQQQQKAPRIPYSEGSVPLFLAKALRYCHPFLSAHKRQRCNIKSSTSINIQGYSHRKTNRNIHTNSTHAHTRASYTHSIRQKRTRVGLVKQIEAELDIFVRDSGHVDVNVFTLQSGVFCQVKLPVCAKKHVMFLKIRGGQREREGGGGRGWGGQLVHNREK